MRLSRPCYDKAHRCPGENGGGIHYAKVYRCSGGRITVRRAPMSGVEIIEEAEGWFNPHPAAHPLRFGHCDKCDVVTWPYAIRYVDPTNVVSEIRWLVRKAKWKIEDWRKA
jgi:hypothetical protein